jgi:tight adherence protein B
VSTTGWLALAAAVWMVAPRAAGAARVAGLTGSGRLGPTPDSPGRERGAGTAALPVAVGVSLACACAVLVVYGLLLAIATGAAGAVGCLLCRDAARRRDEAAGRAEVRSAVRVLIGELEAGSHLDAALRAAAGVAPRHAKAFGAAAVAAARAGDAGGVLVADPRTRAIGLAWRMGTDSGVALAGVLATVAADLRADEDQRRVVDTALSGPRASAVLLSGLPLVGIALGVAMGARPLDVLTGSSAGRLLCCAGVLLDVAGVLWMRRILRRAATR